MSRTTLVVRDGCHLCDEALAVVRTVVGDDPGAVDLVDVDGLPDDDRRRWSEQVPVLLVDGRQVSYWTVDAARLRSALAAGTGRWRPW